ncbi:hypothetical protein GCM10007887_20550 [Methylobacterium haplocladii]|uniref:Anti-sigma factor NepR domain-containing protein n=2 Tax=Methylobacterium haplocladii TaxID=1176176 RepID=A0A512IVM5_9HYPH|nr:hypothetical protein MHA02_41100 [Methylobacterium haplocladii]GJD85320.1 hypothetical protein HPGCJGGD_3208 [Methylobacterium haplocladii]GLS59389.1 hypothetical protein GCM10007887_20550 [Methylobacterium haplocladii]
MPFSSSVRASEGTFDSALLGRIGDDLRHLYDELTDSELPSSLRDLAETVDARRMDASRDA